VNADEKVATAEKQPEQEDGKPVEGDKDNKENSANEEEAKPEDKVILSQLVFFFLIVTLFIGCFKSCFET